MDHSNINDLQVNLELKPDDDISLCNMSDSNLNQNDDLTDPAELEINIMAFANSMVLFWGLGTVDEYCSIDPSWTLLSSWKSSHPFHPLPLATHHVPTTISRCRVCDNLLVWMICKQTTEASGTIISTLTVIMIVLKTQDGMTDINDNKYLIQCVSTKNLNKLNIN